MNQIYHQRSKKAIIKARIRQVFSVVEHFHLKVLVKIK
jgi:hypothetical protein